MLTGQRLGQLVGGAAPFTDADSSPSPEPPATHFTVKVPLTKPARAGDSADLKLSVSAFVCSKGSNFCTIKSFVWTVPVTFGPGGAAKVTIGP